MKTKQCKTCKKAHTLNEFEIGTTHLSPNCATCRVANVTAAKLRKRQYDIAYREANSTHIKQVKADYYAQPSVKADKQAYDVAYRAANAAHLIQTSAVYYIKHNAKIKEQVSARRANTSAHARNLKYLHSIKRADAFKVSTITNKSLIAWKNSQDKICTYCGTTCTSNYHIDHISPISKGGLHELNNLAIACPDCNFSKSSRELLYWMALKIQPKLLEATDKKL